MSQHQTARSILIVEDDPEVNSMLREILSDGYLVECAGDIPQALALLERWRPDVILLDCLLPGGRPDSVVERARDLRCPVVLTSGFPGALQRFKDSGHQCLPKPYRLNELLDAVTMALQRRSQTE